MTTKDGICLNQDTSKELGKTKSNPEERDWLKSLFERNKFCKKNEHIFTPVMNKGCIYKVINAIEYNLADVEFMLKHDFGVVPVPENTILTFLHTKIIFWRTKKYSQSYDDPPEKINEEKCYCFLYNDVIHWCTDQYLPYLREVK